MSCIRVMVAVTVAVFIIFDIDTGVRAICHEIDGVH